jgi:hypothetical protein
LKPQMCILGVGQAENVDEGCGIGVGKVQQGV